MNVRDRVTLSTAGLSAESFIAEHATFLLVSAFVRVFRAGALRARAITAATESFRGVLDSL